MLEKQQSSGVSPVIGIILMVAVTVGLVALASTIVFDLGSNVNKPADVSGSVGFDTASNEITAEAVRNENAQRVTLRMPKSGGGEVEAVVADGTGTTGTFTIEPQGGNDVNDNKDTPNTITENDISASGTAELVANVGTSDNEQVIDTVNYDTN